MSADATPSSSLERPREAPGGLSTLVDATLGRVAAVGFALGSRLRGRRVFHPDGVAFTATLVVDPGRPLGASLLDEPVQRPCVVRLSRGVGLPEAAPDVLGVAVRVLPGREGAPAQDLLFATVLADEGPGRHMLAPARSFDQRPLGTILPYRTLVGSVVLTLHGQGAEAGAPTLEGAAEAFEAGRLDFELRAHVDGRASSVGRLRGGDRLDAATGEALRFNPFHAAEDLRPAGVLNALRRRSYAWSQAGRQVA